MFDQRLVTHCDSCGAEIEEDQFVGWSGLTELLGVAFCLSCAEKPTGTDFALALMNSDLLSEKGREAVADWLHLQAPADVRDLVAILRHGQAGHALDRSREN